MSDLNIDRKKPYSGYIGAFDSGVGGITVLRAMTSELPHENFIYYGDSANAPYGDRPAAEIMELSENVMKHLLDQGAKAVVIACNTATSAAAAQLRKEYPAIPIIGIEPAIKPAAVIRSGGRYLVMATAATLKLDKYHELERTLERDNEFIPLACSGLVELIEKGDMDSDEIKLYLRDILRPYVGNVDGIVLGCTHYPFVREQIRKVMGENVRFFDGAEGTARELRRRLSSCGLLNTSEDPGDVKFQSSMDSPDEIEIYKNMYRLSEGLYGSGASLRTADIL